MNNQINDIIFDNMKEFFNNMENEYEGFDGNEMYNNMISYFEKLSVSPKSNGKGKSRIKKNTSSAKKVIDVSTQCMAMKADGKGRCSQKKSTKEGMNHELCSIHNKKPPKQYYTEPSVVETSEEECDGKEIQNSDNESIVEIGDKNCVYMYKKGIMKGQLCNKTCSNKMCDEHMEIPNKVKQNSIEKIETIELEDAEVDTDKEEMYKKFIRGVDVEGEENEGDENDEKELFGDDEDDE
jgi:hypothetical protein